VAKQGGLGSRFIVGGYDLSGDINAVGTIGSTLAPGDITGIDKYAHERLALLRDGTMSFTAFFDPGGAHPVLSALPGTDTLMTYIPPPQAIGSPAANLDAIQVSYNPTRSNAGDLTIACEGQGDTGVPLEWGVGLTAGIREDSTATNGADLDNGAATSSGAAVYLQVTQFTGSTAAITVQQSADNSTWTTLAAFTAVTAAPDNQRAAVTGTVGRYLRVISAGTFTSLQFAAFVSRYPDPEA
jgi:hypothetical protein